MNQRVKSSVVNGGRDMSATEFKAWLELMGYTGAAAAKALGISKASVSNYQREGAPPAIRLACRVLYPRQGEAVFPWEVA
jgi:DNA-binding XRE family transcriptional regulator